MGKLTAKEAGKKAYEVINEHSQIDDILGKVDTAANSGKFILFYESRISLADKNVLERELGYSVAFKDQGTVIGWSYIPDEEDKNSENEE